MNQKNRFFTRYKIVISISLFISIFAFGELQYFDYIKEQKEQTKQAIYKVNSTQLKKNIESMIEQKRSTTMAIALSLSMQDDLALMMKNSILGNVKIKKLINNLKNSTLYKNTWVHIVDKKGFSLYRSWTEKNGDNLLAVREDIKTILKTHNLTSSISVGKFNLSIKAIVPIMRDNKFLGIVEVISHFNSISEALKKLDIDSVIIVNKEKSKNIKFPFTKLYIGKNYIANFNAPQKLRNYLEKEGVENYLSHGYKVNDEYLIVSHTIKDNTSKALGSFVMFKKLSTIVTPNLDFFTFKLMSIFIFLLMLLIMFRISLLYSKNKKQKQYYKNVIDSSASIIIISNGERFLSVNKVFFEYFDHYVTIEGFVSDHRCICELFDKDTAYLQKEMDGLSWMQYLVKHNGETFKVKIHFKGKTYYFSIFASLISDEKNHYSITLSDITVEEEYKQELEILTATDPLTNIGNRRHSQVLLDEEIAKAYRYKSDLSLIVFDIDHFKGVNDQYGHSVGDEVLVEYTSLIQSKLRTSDVFCRIGGEEFIIITPHINIENAFKLAEKLRKDVEMHRKIIPITVSFGVTQYIYGENKNDIFNRADKALYKAKNGGRNKVIIG